MTEKSINYETFNLSSGNAWIKKAAFLAGNDNYQISEGTHNFVISTYMNPNSYTSDKLYEVSYGATTADVSAALNDGRSIVTFSGHGGKTLWSDGPYFDQSNVRSLTNSDKYPFIFSFACHTGDFAYSECFGETWLREVDKASIEFWGSSNYTYWDEDDILEKRLFKAIFEDDLFEAADMTNQAKMYFYQHYGDLPTTKYYFEVYNILGSPVLELWTDTPSEFTDVDIMDDGEIVYVNVVGESGCDITASSGDNGAIYHEVAHNVSGTGFETPVRPLYVTVTKHNYLPYTAVTGGTFTSDETWFGNLHALGSVTFDGNSTLEVLPGTKVLFDAKYSLCIKAGSKIIAEGTESSPIYFTSTNGTSRKSWGTLFVNGSDNIFKWCIVEYGDWGLKLNGSPSPASNNIVENCTFRNNDQGLRMEKNEVDVISCNIYDNRHNIVTINNTQIDIQGTRIYDGDRDGIYSTSGNLVNIYGSVIENNGIGGSSSRNGIYTRSSDVIELGNTSGSSWEGYNTIRYNYSTEIYAYYGNPIVKIFYNSIHDNSGYEIYNYSGNPSINALFSWFGESPPNMSQFSGDVNIIDPLEMEPSWEGQTQTGGLSKPASFARSSMNPEEHIQYLKELILSDPLSFQADSALSVLYSILRSDYITNAFGEQESFFTFLSHLHSDYLYTPISNRAIQYMIIWKMLANENERAIQLSSLALNHLSGTERMCVMGNMVYLYAYTGQIEKANQLLDNYIK
ncbi:MAG: hypothetical protein DRP89_07590 [Candidatus Neomarinimicrobiota bacterium]|nr:MAG: hypothetical protein DRP89_07590 [Candidatus Neomarinimicrobiota bacterium]